MENNQDFVIGGDVLKRYEGHNSDVTIPAAVTVIGYKAFADCPDLTLHTPSGSFAEQYAKENNIRFEATAG